MLKFRLLMLLFLLPKVAIRLCRKVLLLHHQQNKGQPLLKKLFAILIAFANTFIIIINCKI